jgi:CHAT domain-containing protein
LISKAAATFLTAFVMSAVLLSASHSPAFQQGARVVSERQSPEAASQAEELFQAALLLYDTQEHQSSRLRLQEAMRLWVQMREPGKAGKAALQMGDRYKQAGQYRDALYYYRQALEVKSLPSPVKMNALNAHAMIYTDLYQHDLAESYFIQALDLAQLINDLSAQTLALTDLANLYYHQGEKAQALEYIARAQRLNKKRNVGTAPALLCLLGQINQEDGLIEEAKGAFEQALAIYEKTLNAEGQVRALCSLSSLDLLSSQKQAALEKAQQAVDIAEKQAKSSTSHAERTDARELQWRARLSRARAERALGQKASALKSYSWAINHFEGVWLARNIITEARAIASREEIQAGYREYVDLKIEHGEFKEAYELADQFKARAILSFSKARQLKPVSMDSNQAAIVLDLSKSLGALRLQALAPNISLEQKAKLQKEIDDIVLKLQEAQLPDEMANSRDRLIWSKLANTDHLQKQMARDQMTLAEFSLGEERSFVWFFTPKDFFFETLPGRKEIEKAVISYLALLAAAPNHLHLERGLTKLKARGEELFSTLFGSLAAQIEPGRRLIVVPDGLLHYLPFETLIRNGRYLVEDHDISYNSSANMLGLWQDSGSRVESGDKMELLAVGDPLFEPGAKAAGGNGLRTRSSKPAQKMAAARGVRLPPLPRTRDEIQYIANLFPADRRKIFLGRHSTEEAIKRESLERYRRLHFATHSRINEKSPLLSAVALAPGDDAEEDGFLEVSEISRLNLDCDLVVVSACQTGRGQLLSAEGIVGLSRAFLFAGARSVVVSLWNVTDASTSRLMKGFYKHLVSGIGNAAALREAKLQMIRLGGQTQHPYYWASFVMVGKP